MAVYGILSDLHGNLEGLDAALAELDRRRVHDLLCLGDLVGYNADSDAVVERLRARGAACIAGNHDLIAVGALGTDRCWYQAAHALERTRSTLHAASRSYLAALPAWRKVDERVLLVHGELGDPQRYVRTALDVADAAAKVRAAMPHVAVCLYGHTHAPRFYRARPDGEVIEYPAIGALELRADPGEILFVNPGSIDGQRKRRGERAAELAILDTDLGSIEFVRVAYDDAVTEGRAKAGGYRVDAAGKLAHLSRRWAGRAARALRAARGRPSATGA